MSYVITGRPIRHRWRRFSARLYIMISYRNIIIFEANFSSVDIEQHTD